MKIDVTKLAIVLDYMQRGGEVFYEGRKLVWLDEHTVREDESHRWVVDGLAIKTKKLSAKDWLKYGDNDPNVGETYYMGHDMSVTQFGQFINNMSPVEFQRIATELVKMRNTQSV